MLKSTTVAMDDSNIAHLGGKEEHDARKAAAMGEEAFKCAGSNAGLEIWRVEKLAIISWPKAKYGQFFSGDSYIVLNTKVDKATGKKSFDVHSWQGAHTSIDERTVSAYKMVELDDILGDVPVQHRDVEGEESSLFHSYFKHVTVMEGGIETGFNHMEPESYVPRLLHFKGKGKCVRATQVPMAASSMNNGDCFILDAGLKIFQWNGPESGGFEKHKAADVTNALVADREKASHEVVDGDDDNAEFWALIGGSYADVMSAADGGDDSKAHEFEKCMFRLSDASGELTFEKVAEGKLEMSALESKDVFIVDDGITVFVWVGKDSSPGEKKNAFPSAERYLANAGRPSGTPVTRVIDGSELLEQFEDIFR